MTIEEKAKAYDEALERAKYTLTTDMDHSGHWAVKHIFPELAESEDERIRKAIWLVLVATEEDQDAFYRTHNITRKECTDWLEKQKAKERYDRMAPIYENKESFESALDKAWKFYNGSASATLDGLENNFRELTFAKGFREGFLYKEKQKEPENVSATTMIPSCWAEKQEKQEPITISMPFNPDDYEVVGNGNATELRRKQKEQKPAEWSEEDDQLIGFIFDLLNDLVWRKDWAMSKEECLERLKSLRPQPKQEWSKEDKQKLNRIYEILGYAADDKGFLTSKRIIGDKEAIVLQDFLKSLRPQPHWKPSEEQMNFLLRLEGELRAENHPVAAKTLAEIYEQLKKLI